MTDQTRSVALVVCLLTATARADEVRFNHDIRPILSDYCFQCHGFDAKQRRAELRLDVREGAIAVRTNGIAAVVPGDPTRSELIARVTSADPDYQMPPSHIGKKLGPDEMRKLTLWIESGAIYEKHWSFIRPQKRRLPQVSRQQWPSDHVSRAFVGTIHSFCASLLRERPIEFDVDPAFRELDEQEDSRLREQAWQENSESAWVSAVERLLASPHLGEKWARWWMDLAHYADTDGYTIDYDRPHAWRWRRPQRRVG